MLDHNQANKLAALLQEIADHNAEISRALSELPQSLTESSDQEQAVRAFFLATNSPQVTELVERMYLPVTEDQKQLILTLEKARTASVGLGCHLMRAAALTQSIADARPLES